ncbi:MAG: ABC transporter permease [Candidatus Kapaibacterium sp.]
MQMLLGSVTIGLILSFLAIGVFISFRIFDFPDITAEGSFAFGGAVGATLIVLGLDPFVATFIAFCGGMLAGTITGVLHTKFKINELLAGILVMTAAYSINLHVMGRSNLPLMNEITLFTYFEKFTGWIYAEETVNLLGWQVFTRDLIVMIITFAIVAFVALALFWFFRTNLGASMRATGDNPQMIRALGVNTEMMIVVGLAISNGMIAMSGAMLAQYQGFADVQMGLGMLVWGIASLIIGESLIGEKSVGFVIVGAIIGSVLFRLLVAIALKWGMDPNDLKLITAIFVFLALILPGFIKKFKEKKGRLSNAGIK